MKNWHVVVICSLGLFLISCNQPTKVSSQEKVVSSSKILVDYNIWNNVLRTYVNDEGLVNYDGLKANRGKLDQFVAQVKTANIDSLSSNEKKTFWINAYNALTLNLIVDNYPLKFGGIRTINWGRPWSIKMKVANQDLTLGEIEHEILRKWDPIDPRIHFAINCASIGCPKLPNKPFYPETLDEQLEFEAKRFINDKEKIRLDKTTNILHFSAILDWFKDDFLVVEEDILSYIKRYLNEEDVNYLESHEVTLKASKYDWGLNKK